MTARNGCIKQILAESTTIEASSSHYCKHFRLQLGAATKKINNSSTQRGKLHSLIGQPTLMQSHYPLKKMSDKVVRPFIAADPVESGWERAVWYRAFNEANYKIYIREGVQASQRARNSGRTREAAKLRK